MSAWKTWTARLHREAGSGFEQKIKSPKLSVALADIGEHGGRWPIRLSRCVPGHHSRGKFGEILTVLRRTGVMRSHAQMLGREAKRQCCAEFVNRLHLPVEPGVGVGAE